MTRKLRDMVGKTIKVNGTKMITRKDGKTAMVLETDLGQFYATPNVTDQLSKASDPKGTYLVASFKPKVGDGLGIALRNLPPQ